MTLKRTAIQVKDSNNFYSLIEKLCAERDMSVDDLIYKMARLEKTSIGSVSTRFNNWKYKNTKPSLTSYIDVLHALGYALIIKDLGDA